MNLLKTLLVYLTMVFVSSVQVAPDPSLVPETPTPLPTVTISASAVPTQSPTPVPTPDITPNNEYRTLQVGDRSDNVKTMQQRLTELGYYTGEMDGAYGNQTRRAVERFQYNNGLSVDGIAGKRTLTVLYESKDVVAAPVEASSTSEATPAASEPTETPAPTFAPTPSPTPAPTPEPAEDTPEPSEPAETGMPQPTIAVDTPELLENRTFLLAGENEALTLQNDVGLALTEPQTLHPLQKGDVVYVPFLEIIRDAGSVILPGAGDVVWETAFTLNEELYQFSYTPDDTGRVSGLTINRNQEPIIVSDRSGYLLNDVLYLPMQTTVEGMSVAYVLDEATGSYTVTLSPEQDRNS